MAAYAECMLGVCWAYAEEKVEERAGFVLGEIAEFSRGGLCFYPAYAQPTTALESSTQVQPHTNSLPVFNIPWKLWVYLLRTILYLL